MTELAKYVALKAIDCMWNLNYSLIEDINRNVIVCSYEKVNIIL